MLPNFRPPTSFLGVPVPDEIARQWDRWEGAEWRLMHHRSTNNSFPPDQRYSVLPPSGMCPVHLDFWVREQTRDFDPVSGNRWPGHPGSPFSPVECDLNRVREWRRCEWDEKASQAMRRTEVICLSGSSPQCSGERVTR
jgi:hypothetical protein